MTATRRARAGALSALTFVLTLVLSSALWAVLSTPATAGSGVRAAAQALPSSPVGDPPGANRWSCKPSKARPTPVILVHGTFGDRSTGLERLSATIKRAGFCVYSLDYGNRGTGDIRASAAQLKTFTQRVLRSTRAQRVSMVGHSQGGLMARYYLKFLGGKRVVDDLVGLAPINHGSTTGPPEALVGPDGLVIDCRSCEQRQAGSAFLRRLNAGDETPGRVSYTNVVTRYDEVASPYRTGYLRGPRTTNITLQDLCPMAFVEHLTIPSSGPAIAIALDALRHRGPARAGFRPSCLP